MSKRRATLMSATLCAAGSQIDIRCVWIGAVKQSSATRDPIALTSLAAARCGRPLLRRGLQEQRAPIRQMSRRRHRHHFQLQLPWALIYAARKAPADNQFNWPALATDGAPLSAALAGSAAPERKSEAARATQLRSSIGLSLSVSLSLCPLARSLRWFAANVTLARPKAGV